MKILLLVAVLFSFVDLQSASRERNKKPYKIVCYWGSWSYYRPNDGKFSAENIDPNLCTHIIYGFAKLQENKIAFYDSYLDVGDHVSGGLGMYRRFNELRKKNKQLTSLIAIGGWNEGSRKYSEMAKSPATRKIFVESVVKFLKDHDFDGLDLDWEYPGFLDEGKPGGNLIDKQNYASLVKELRAALNPGGYLLTAAVSAGRPTIDVAYDVPALSKNLDFINVMAYDFHGAWEIETGHNAPLHPKAGDKQLDREFTVEFAVNHWIKKGADPKKLILGMPLYGRTFTLADPKNNGFKAKATGSGGNPGPYTRQAGTLGYNEICVLFKQGGWQRKWDSTYKVPYAVKGNQWIGYDDRQSIQDKVNFVKSKKLGGAMSWSLETDDFRGLCGEGTFPLMRTIDNGLNSGPGPDKKHTVGPTEATTRPTWWRPDTTKSGTQPTGQPTGPVTSQRPTKKPTRGPTKRPTQGPTQGPSEEFKCKRTGFFPDPTDKQVYYECVDGGNGTFRKFTFRCGTGTVYDPVRRVCVWPQLSFNH